MEILEFLSLGFGVSLQPANLFYCFIGVFFGTAIGVLPGLGPAGAIAVLLPITYQMDLVSAIIMLAGIYYGTQFGGSITSILVNIPGEATSVVTCYEGHPMAKQGRAGVALGICAFGSFIGGTAGVVGLSLLAPVLAKFALAIGPIEYTALLVLGLSLVIFLCSNSITKGLIMAVTGFLLGTVGVDPISGIDRFTFGSQTLVEGVNVGVLAMGIFGIGEILLNSETQVSRGIINASTRLRELLPKARDWKDAGRPMARGTVLGFLLGCLPGGGAVIASFLSYAIEKRLHRHPEKFGTGITAGLAGPETANNAASSGAFIPLLILGIPANVVMALLVGAFMLHGVTPGPTLLSKHPEMFWGIVTSMYVGNIMLLVLNVPLIGLFVQILRVRQAILTPLIIMICFIGAYSLNNNIVDVVMMVLFGVVGYLMRKFEFDSAPFILAFILGPMLEKELRRSLIIADGNPMVFLDSFIATTFVILTILLYAGSMFSMVAKVRKKATSSVSVE